MPLVVFPFLARVGAWLFSPAVCVIGLRWLEKRWVGWVHVRYLPDRKILNNLFPVEHRIKKTKEIHAYWVTGETWLDLADDLLANKIKRVILPDPGAVARAKLYATDEHKPQPGEEELNRIAKTFRDKHRAKVKFCRSLLGPAKQAHTEPAFVINATVPGLTGHGFLVQTATYPFEG